MQNELREIGVVCGMCDTFSALGTKVCPVCACELTLFVPARTSTPPPFKAPVPPVTTAPQAKQPVALPVPPRPAVDASSKSAPAKPARPAEEGAKTRPGRAGPAAQAKSEFADLSQEELMEQARNYICRSCSSGVPTGHKFCGRCGTAVPIEILNAQTLFFGDMQNPAKAKLILIRGEGMDGLSFHLKAEQHIVGRNGQLVFPDDPFVSPKHANFFYRDGKLVVRDEGSLNGVYKKLRRDEPILIRPGEVFRIGQEIVRFELLSPMAATPDGVERLGSPSKGYIGRIALIIGRDVVGNAFPVPETGLHLGRERGDVLFPEDGYVSGLHCRLAWQNGQLFLTDLGSSNGSFVRISAETEVGNGDVLLMGQQLFRVNM